MLSPNLLFACLGRTQETDDDKLVDSLVYSIQTRNIVSAYFLNSVLCLSDAPISKLYLEKSCS